MRAVVALLLLVLAACASPEYRGRYNVLSAPVANPGKVVATELAFARMAQEKGQWAAFRAYATDDAVIFADGPVNAQQWLKQQSEPSEAVKWQPHEVWSSCDGSLAVTRGAWQRPNGSTGYFTTVWQRQKDGEYKWVMDQGDPLAEPLVAPEFIRTRVADCRKPGSPPPPVTLALYPEGTKEGGGTSADNSLRWNWVSLADGRRQFTTGLFLDGEWQTVITSQVAAPQ